MVSLQSTILLSIYYLGEILQVSETYGPREGIALCPQKVAWATSGRNHSLLYPDNSTECLPSEHGCNKPKQS